MLHQLCSGALVKHVDGKRLGMVKVSSKIELCGGKWMAGSEVNK